MQIDPCVESQTSHKDKLEVMWEMQDSFMQLLREKRNFPTYPFDMTVKQNQRHLSAQQRVVGLLY
jgi:hypothetical protein